MNTYTFDEIKVGQKEEFLVQIDEEKEAKFREISNDINPLHSDDAFARNAGKYKEHVVYGMLTASYYSTLAGVYLPGKFSLIHSINADFMQPVYRGDVLTVTGEVVDKQEELHLLMIKAVIRNQNNKKVSRANMKVIVLAEKENE